MGRRTSTAADAGTIPGSRRRTAIFAPLAANPRASQILQGWFEDRVVRQSNVELTRETPFPYWFFHLESGAEALVTRAQVTLHVDRPMRASGERLESRIPASHLLERDDLGARVTLLGRRPVAGFRPFALALPNALLTVAEPVLLELSATLSAPSEMRSGAIRLALPLYQLLPSLPDPYAANFELKAPQAPDDGVRVVATVIWTAPFDAHLDLTLDPPPFNMQALGSVLPDPNQFRVPDSMTQRFNRVTRQRIDDGLVLLDVSSNAGQLGVALGFGDQPHGGLSIRDLTLNVSGSNAAVFLLPQFQCEPVFNKANPRVPGEIEKPLFFVDDAGPTLAAANTVRLVQVRPLALLEEVVHSYEQDKRSAGVLFTLPFGIQAVAELDPLDRELQRVPQLQIVTPRFENLDGAPQLALSAGTTTDGQVRIMGRAQQLENVNVASSPPPGALGQVVGDAFNASFFDHVPIDRIGLTGYGANIFSRWFDARKPDVGITQVAFDAFHGRTAYERVMMTSYLLPCFARVVRTITFERYGSGAVVRWDSGWLATTPGLFAHGAHKFHQGVIGGVHNIREIMDTDYTVNAGGAILQAVYYDADIAVQGVIRGADGRGRVPAKRHLGFIQQLTLPLPPPPGAPPLPPLNANVITPAQMRDLFASQGRLGGPVDCQIRVGNSPHEMKVSGVFASNASSNEFAVAAYGVPALQAAGQWSVVSVTNATGSVEPVDASGGIPLVRADGGPFRWAAPADLLVNEPAVDYAILFSSSAQRILFARPKIDAASTQITSVVPPLLADPYALMKSPGLFPGLEDAHPFDGPGWGLELAAGRLQLTPTPLTVTARLPKRSLLQTSSWGAMLDYSDDEGPTKFVIDSAADWAIKGTGIQQILNFPVVGEVMRIVHGIEAPAVGDDSFPDTKVMFDGALEAVTDVLSMLQQWAPNLPSPLKVDIGLKGTAFRLYAAADFNITDDEGNAIDCGMGKLKGNLQVGAELSVDLLKRSTNGAIFFEVTGSWQQLIFPFIYGGGLMRFAVRAEDSGKTTLVLDAAVTGSVGGDLIPGLVSLEATVKYGYFLQVDPISPGFLVGIEGRAKLLSGLLGFKLGIEGRISVTRPVGPANIDSLCNLHGEILVAGTVTLCWLVDERKSFRTHYDVNVGWELALVAAKTALLPVP